MMNLFTDKHNFFDNITLGCITILIALQLIDYYTTTASLTLGWKEINSVMVPYVMNPFIFAIIKISVFILLISIIKGVYDWSMTIPEYNHAKIVNYMAFGVMGIIEFIIAHQNVILLLK